MTPPRESWIATGWTAVWLLFFLACIVAFAQTAHSETPAVAAKWQRLVTREARAYGGLGAPVAVFAGQIEQESHWNPNAASAYAEGLTEFTPATAKWIAGAYPKDLAHPNPYNPDWAVRALVIYDLRLYKETDADPDCDHWAKTLSAYNGGLGWVLRDEKLCNAHFPCDESRWWKNVERYSARDPSAFRENRDYPRRILLRNQLNYVTWGGVVSCTSD